MNICFHANCQALGLQYFFERSPDARGIATKVIQDFQVVLGETSREQELAAVEEADIIFYHAIGGVFPVKKWTPKKRVKLIPMSVWYNSGPFLSGASRDSWDAIIVMAREVDFGAAVHHAVHEADMRYAQRWAANLAKMEAKENREGVPEQTRISSWTAEGVEARMHLTMNHPTTDIFLRWANLLLRHIGLSPVAPEHWKRRDLNLVGLPCEDHACSGAVKHLGLGWGGDEQSNLWNYEIARKKIRAQMDINDNELFTV
jgi:hypothetical protein